VTVSGWTVQNQGTLPSGSFYNGYYFSTDSTITNDDWYLGGNSNSSLEAGESYTWGTTTLTIPEDLNIGNYYIGILVDRSNAVTETSENNNTASRQISVEYPVGE
jgi:hypothetical protein